MLHCQEIMRMCYSCTYFIYFKLSSSLCMFLNVEAANNLLKNFFSILNTCNSNIYPHVSQDSYHHVGIPSSPPSHIPYDHSTNMTFHKLSMWQVRPIFDIIPIHCSKLMSRTQILNHSLSLTSKCKKNMLGNQFLFISKLLQLNISANVVDTVISYGIDIFNK